MEKSPIKRYKKNPHIIRQEVLMAVAENDISALKILLKAGAKLHMQNDIILKNAVKNNNIEMVDMLLKKGANVHTDLDYPLRTAVKNNYVDIVAMLIKNGARINVYDNLPLKLAVSHNHVEIVNMLLKAGANFMYKKILECAVSHKYHEIIKLLLDAHPIPSPFIGNILRDMVPSSNDMKSMCMLIDASTIIDSDILLKAVLGNRQDIVMELIPKVIDRSVSMQTAITCNYNDILSIALNRGIDPNDGDLLYYAIKYENVRAVKLLLDARATIRTDRDWPEALTKGNVDIIKALSRAGIVTHPTMDNAICRGDYGTIDLLIRCEIPIDNQTKELILERGDNIIINKFINAGYISWQCAAFYIRPIIMCENDTCLVCITESSTATICCRQPLCKTCERKLNKKCPHCRQVLSTGVLWMAPTNL